jgi:hypothetical protein
MQTPDLDKSCQLVKLQIEHAVKTGELTREKAHETLKGAEESYRKKNYFRALDQINARIKK